MENEIAKVEQNLEKIQNSEEPKSLDLVEQSVSDFVQDSFKDLRSDFRFEQAIQEEVKQRLGTLNNAELITALSNTSSSLNEKLARVLSPTFSVITSKQQAEIAASKSQVNNIQVNNLGNLDIPSEVLQGLDTLSKIFGGQKSRNVAD